MSCCLTGQAFGAGTWASLNQQAPDNIDTMLLLPDGTVMAASGETLSGEVGNAWYRLTPDANGSYVNGTWSTLAPMHYTRLYYSSQVLRDGRVLVAGSEYGTGTNSAEIYNPLTDTWTITPPPPPGQQLFYDSVSEILPNGDVLVSPVTPATYGGTVIYRVQSNQWVTGPTLVNSYYQDEASWVKLPDNSILTIDPFGTNSERYIPALNQWVNDATVPVLMYDDPNGGELGAALLLPNGKVLFLGATGNTALYTPSGTTNMGTWQTGPQIPNGLVAADAPAAMMVNGNVLCAVTQDFSNSTPVSFFEYDPVGNSFTQVDGPTGQTLATLNFSTRMLDLPDGTVLYSTSDTQLYVYRPAGSALAAGQPVIAALSTNSDGSFHLTGKLFNGICEGAAYGDDAQMNSNFPLVRLTNSAGNVYYARTLNWSSTGVMTGTNTVSTDFVLPDNVPAGAYSLVVVANGNASAPVSFLYLPDSLLISPSTGLAFSGNVGGPFTPASINLTLTNLGSTSLHWSLINTSTWLSVSATSGTLAPSGPATSVTVSPNGSANALPAGTYTNTLVFSNATSHYVQKRVFTLQASPPELVQNGGFETGDFTDWTLSGLSAGSGYEDVVSLTQFVHSGRYGARIGPYEEVDYLYQFLPTSPGQVYLVSFWLANYDNTGGPSQFSATWDTTSLFYQTDLGQFDWTNMQFVVTAASSSTSLEFGFQNDPDYFGFDDVSVTPIQPPAFTSVTRTNGNVTLSWGALTGVAYQVQYKTDLSQSGWFNLGAPITATNSVQTASDIAPADPARFYRLELLP